jgi:hypothetical protein
MNQITLPAFVANSSEMLHDVASAVLPNPGTVAFGRATAHRLQLQCRRF